MTRLINRHPETTPPGSIAPDAPVRLAGVVTFHNEDKGFGMLHARGVEYFFHATACRGLEGEKLFGSFVAGTPVTFFPGQTNKGPRAFELQVDEAARATAGADEDEDTRGNR